MKSQMSSFDIAAVVRELRQCIGMKAEKFFLVDHRELFFRLSGQGTKNTIVIKLGRGIWLEEGFRTVGDSEPPTFAMLLRKYVSGKPLTDVRQHGFDRVVELEFDRGIRIIAELFGSGNIILTEGDRIIQPLTSKSWRARDVKAGRDYLFPPESQDPLSLDLAALTAIIRGSGKDLVRCLATEVNLGGLYAEDVCSALGVGKNTGASELTDEDIAEALDIIESYRAALDSPEPHILMDDDGVPADVLPFRLGMHEGMESKGYGTFSVAAKEYFESIRDAEQAERKSPRRAQLEHQLESQNEALAGLDAQAVEFQETGDMLYSNYTILDGILREVSVTLKGGNWQALRKKIEDMASVESFDPASGLFAALLPEGQKVELDTRKDLNENAASFYDRAKRARHKAEGAREAIAGTEKLLNELQEAEEVREVITDKMPTKRFWFDRYRWFLSSDGLMVVGGRDTRTNDQVVKKHLKDEDLYAHADVNGAPSVVIKEGSRAAEATLEEACIFAVAFSRAWKSRLASGSAYWVKPDQVSKTPQPGEFVPKGAFIIRGKRNYSKKIELRLAIGMVSINGADKVMCGPVSAVKAHAKEYFTIEPGEEKRSNFAKMLSDLYKIPIEEIDRALPTGDLRVLKE